MLRSAGCRGVVCADYCLGELARVRSQVPDIGWVLGLETGEGSEAVPVESEVAVDSMREASAKHAGTR